MRRRVALVLGSIVVLAAPAAAEAQQDGRGYSSPLGSMSDMLRPYAPNSSAQNRGYYRAPVSRPEPAAAPVVRGQTVRNYFPMMRTGQGPNRNVVDPRTLCVPGRRAMLMMPQQSMMMMSSMGGLVTSPVPMSSR